MPAPRYDAVYWDAVARMEDRERPGPLAGICEMPGGCSHGHQSMNGVHFLMVQVDGALTRICGGCWDALRKVNS